MISQQKVTKIISKVIASASGSSNNDGNNNNSYYNDHDDEDKKYIKFNNNVRDYLYIYQEDQTQFVEMHLGTHFNSRCEHMRWALTTCHWISGCMLVQEK